VKLAVSLLLLLILLAACKGASEPQTVKVSGEEEIEQTLDETFAEEDYTTYSDDLDSLDSDLAFS
jgi:hypothetical protein